MKVGVKTNFGRLATIFQICAIDADTSLKIHNAFLDPFKRRTLHESWKDKSVISQPVWIEGINALARQKEHCAIKA